MPIFASSVICRASIFRLFPLKFGSGYTHKGRADKDSYPHDCRADNAPYRHDRRADKNPYRHDRNMRFSSQLNYAVFSILMVSFCLKLCFIAVGLKHLHFNECITRTKAFETKM